MNSRRLMNGRIILFLTCAWLLTIGPASAEPLPEGIVLQVFGGAPLNFSTTLKITQQGEPEISHSASWESRPWEQPSYWALRLRWQREHDGFEVQFLHHKMYLKEPPATVQHFEVTHGFNILTANYLRRSRPVHWRVGAGVTLPNTLATVRGEFSDVHDYSIGGPAVLAGCGSELALTRRLFLAAEAQFIAGWTTDDIARGEARVTSVAIHILFGIGFVL